MVQSRIDDKRRWLAVAAWLVFQLILTSLPGQDIPDIDVGFRIDRIVHFGMYAVLGALIVRALIAEGRGLRATGCVLIILALSGFGALDELHQSFIPARDAEVGDWVADTLGSAAGIMAAVVLLKTVWGGRWLR